MGWMWSSQSPPSKGPNPNPNTTEETNKPTPTTKQPESDYSDPEIAKFMSQLQAEFGGSSSSNKPAEPTNPTKTHEPEETTSTSTSTSSSSSWTQSLWGPWKSTPAPSTNTTTTHNHTPSKPPPQITPSRLDPISESLLPTTMSCRQAFDAAFHCNSLGGQWTSVYRSGEMRTCSEHWEDFWFCMRTRSYSSPQKEDAIRAHYRGKEYAKYFAPGRPSSVDVWEPRDEKVEPGTAFTEPLELPDVSDEEWRTREIERRKRVQEMLAEKS